MTYKDPQYNPYTPGVSNYESETPPLDQVIRMAITDAIMRLRVHLPGQITNIRGPQQVDVLPLLQTRYQTGEVKNLPIIQNVMVGMPMGALYSIKFPISVGDTGSLIFCDRSLDRWSFSDGGPVDPQDNRMHDISDPVFYPGLTPFTKQIQDTTTDLVMTAGQAQLRMGQKGTFKIQNQANELVSLLSDITDQLKTLASTLQADTVTVSSLGTPTPSAKAIALAYQNIQIAVQQLETKLNTLKG